MELKNLKDIVKIWVNARGITNGELDVNSIEYTEGSDLDKLIEFIRNNDLNENIILEKILEVLNDFSSDTSFRLEGLGRIVNQTILNVIQNELSIQNNQLSIQDIIKILTSSINKNDVNFIDIKLKLSDIQNDIKNMDSKTKIIINKLDDGVVDINRKLKHLSDKIEPKVITIEIERVIKEKEFIETESIFYKGVKTIEEVRKEQNIKRQPSRIKPKNGWFEYSDEWMVNYSFGKESFFMMKEPYQIAIDRGQIPGGVGPLYPPKLFHKLYDK